MSEPTTAACGCKPYSPCDQHQSASDAIEARTDQNTCTCGLDQFKAIRFRVFCPKHDGWAEARAGLDVVSE